MSDPSPDEQDRLDMQQLAAGHDAALNRLMERHSQRLFLYLRRQLPGELEASEIAQESFVKVYLNCATFRSDAKFSTWLYTIATNLVRSHYRWKGRHPEVSMDAHDEEHPGVGAAMPDPSGTPSDVLLAHERAEQVRNAIQALPEDLRTPLILAEYENLSQLEIAEIMNTTRKTVEMRLYRARQILRKSLAELVQVP